MVMTASTTHDATAGALRIPLVDYLVIDNGEPYLVANQCDRCGAQFFDRRNACAKCSGLTFHRVPIGRTGHVKTFTIVHAAAPGVAVPFTAAVVDCEGTSVRTNIVNIEADEDHIRVGMPVRLAVFPLGADASGREAVGFGFEPA
jgi:uncharacterized protein